MSKLVRGLFVAFVAAVVAVIAAPAASAHAVLVSSTPGGFELLADSPKSVALRFTEPVDVGLAHVRLISPRGGDVTGLGAPAHPEGRTDTVEVRIPETLANGTYTVSWRVVSADTHPIQGAFTFSVREATAAAPPQAAAGGGAALLYGVARWLATAGFVLLVGTAFVFAVSWRSKRLRRLAALGAGIAAGGTLAALLLYGPYASGTLSAITDPAVLGSTLSTRIGISLAARIALLAGVLVLIRFWAPKRGATVLGGAAVLAATWSLVAHGATDSLAALTIAVGIVHLTAMSVWLGGLPALILLLRSGDIAAMREGVPRFSKAAGISVAIVVATGLYQTWRQVGTVGALFSTAYGWWLLAKVGLVAVILASGAFARRWVRRQYGFEVVSVTDKRRSKREPDEIGRFQRIVMAEAGLAVVVLAVTASLVATEPARAERERLDHPPVASGPLTLAVPFDAGGLTGKGQVAMVFTPGKVGRNELHLAVLDPSGAPKTVPEVRAELRNTDAGIGPISVPLTAGGPAHYLAQDVGLPMAGRWELALIVRTSPIDQATVRVPVNTV
ncbi:copper resistance CopC/CopD family protein [Actinokineospora sp. HUAS TT18]|uniref:copper resistance CopC/CopD family protein n=1 Tax=Actinokineospora sp. HUAS TT18 TaxID=3447451 RepID=UPI003F5246B4